MTLAAKSFKMMKEWNSNSWKVPLSVDTTPLRGKEEEGGGRRSVVTSQIWTDRLLIKLNWCLYINRSFSYRRWKELRSDQFWIAADRECALFDNNLRNKSSEASKTSSCPSSCFNCELRSIAIDHFSLHTQPWLCHLKF